VTELERLRRIAAAVAKWRDDGCDDNASIRLVLAHERFEDQEYAASLRPCAARELAAIAQRERAIRLAVRS
jgi:hypothetical protein